jgi:hypothetical protein
MKYLRLGSLQRKEVYLAHSSGGSWQMASVWSVYQERSNGENRSQSDGEGPALLFLTVLS